MTIELMFYIYEYVENNGKKLMNGRGIQDIRVNDEWILINNLSYALYEELCDENGRVEISNDTPYEKIKVDKIFSYGRYWEELPAVMGAQIEYSCNRAGLNSKLAFRKVEEPKENIEMNIEQMISCIRKRPGMYVGCLKLEPVVHFINGFLFGRITSKRVTNLDITFKKEFHSWVRKYFERTRGVCLEDGRNYLFYFSEMYEDQEECLTAFFELCDMFFLEIKQMTEET